MVLRKFSQTLRISLALMVATFSSGLIPAATTYAAKSSSNAGGGNVSCPVGTAQIAKYNWNDRTNTYDAEGVANVTVTGSNVSGTFSVNSGYVVKAVVIKGAIDNKIDTYDPAVSSGNFDNTELATPNSNQTPAISNIKFCGSTVSTTQQITTPSVMREVVCGPSNDTYSVVTNANYSIVNNGGGSFTLTAATGYVFTSNGLNTVTITGPVDQNTECERFVFVCKYVGTPGINERLQTGDNPIRVSVNAIPGGASVGAYFADAQGRSFVLAFDTTAPGPAGDPSASACPARANDLIQVPTVPIVDPCGAGNATYGTVPTGNYTFTLNQNGSITFTADPGYEFSTGATATLAAPTETNTAACPTSVCTVSNNSFMAQWMHDGETYPSAGEGGTYEFKSDGLYLSTPSVDAYVYGFMDGGNTKLSDIDALSYETLRLVQSGGFEGTLPAYLLLVDTNGLSTAGGEKYMFYEPYYNGSVTEGNWQTWDAYDNGEAKWYISGTGQTLRTWDYFVTNFPDAIVLAYGFNQGQSNAETFTAIQDITFDCATTTFGIAGGRGGGQVQGDSTTKTTTMTPQTLGAAVLPAALPATGGADSPLAIIIASIIAYGAAYFLQGRRLLGRKEALSA